MKPVALFLLLAFTGMSSCTVTKRQFRPGWHIEWRKNARIETKAVVENGEPVAEAALTDQPVTVIQPEIVVSASSIRTKSVRADQPASHDQPAENASAVAAMRSKVESKKIIYRDLRAEQADEDEPEDPQKARRKERRENLWSAVAELLLVLLVIVLIALVLITLYAAAKVSAGMFLLVLLPVILLVILIACLISLLNFLWEMGSAIGKLLRKGPHP